MTQTTPFPQPLDPDTERMLGLIRKAGYPPLEALSPAAARAAYAASWDAMQSPGAEVASVRDITIATPAGGLPARVYRGLGCAAGERVPAVLYLHGGGWVIGNLDSHDRLCRQLATRARLCVLAVDYRLAPEHPFPAAVEDAADALRWLAAHADELAIEPAAIGVAGDSAGGNLAAVLALMARDGSVPSLAHQALLYPVTDLAADTASYARVTADVPLTAATMHMFIGHYTPDAAQRRDWRASPLRAARFEGCAPALVLTVAHDPLCDEGLAYARALDAAGVHLQTLHLNDQVHGLFGQGRLIRAADRVFAHVADSIGEALHRRAASDPTSQEPPQRSHPGA